MKLLLATGVEELEKCLAKHIINTPSYGIEIVGEVYYREALNNYDSNNTDVVLISEELPGDNDDFIDSTIYSLRSKGLRVILMPGDATDEATKELVAKCATYGVYDFVYNNVTVENIIDKILNPSTIKHLGFKPDELKLNIVDSKPDKIENDNVMSKLKSIFKPKNTQPATEADITVANPKAAQVKNASIDIGKVLSYKNTITVDSNNNNQIVEYSQKNKESLVIIDADNGKLAQMLGVDPNSWEHDWRIGLSAKPFKVNKRTELYTVPYEREDREWEDRDIRALHDIIKNATNSKKKVIVVAPNNIEKLLLL